MTQTRGEADELLASLASPECGEDPYPVYRRLRELGPAHKSPSAVFLTSYEACAAVTRDPGFHAQSPEWHDRMAPGWRDHPAKVATFEAMLFRDPPAHTRLRRLVGATFTPRQAEAMREEVAALAGRALDALADAGADGSPVNLQQILASSLPISVIATLVGVPAADWGALQSAMSALLEVVELGTGAQQLGRANAAALALHAYFAGLASDRSDSPRADLTSALVKLTRPDPDGGGAAGGADGAGNGGGWLTEQELAQMLTFVFMAGVDTMINMLTNGTAALLANPAQAAALRSDPGLTPRAVDEILRYDPPVQYVGRVAARDTTVAGIEVRADGLVIAMLGAASRDPARFAEPETFDVSRSGTTVMSFGGGIHYCLGAPLARLEAGSFFPALLARFPRLHGAGEPRRRGLVFRGFSDLPVAFR
jgi:cytochrome P450